MSVLSTGRLCDSDCTVQGMPCVWSSPIELIYVSPLNTSSMGLPTGHYR